MKRTFVAIICVSLFFQVFANSNVIINNQPYLNDGINLTVENTINILRKDEIVELDFSTLLQKNNQLFSTPFIVVNSLTGEQYPYQIVNDDSNNPIKLLVQITLAPLATIDLTIKKGNTETSKTKTFGRYVPERKDDFAWENDKIAFRMYGPALQATGEVSSGVDVWVKRTSDMIIDKWYKIDKYHTDNGEGMDCYKVGPTLGAGGIAPYVNGKLVYSKNWATQKLIFTGPLRTVFELTYQPWSFNGVEISETKRITLNAGSQLNQVEVFYAFTGMDTIQVAAGIVKRKENGVIVMNERDGFISYWEPTTKKYGTTGVGIVVPSNSRMTIADNHLLALAKAINKIPFKYYQGACWDRAGEIKNEDEWTNYLKEFALKVQTPLIISFQ